MKTIIKFFSFLVIALSFVNVNAQNSQKKSLQPITYGENVNEPLTQFELQMLAEVYQDKLEEYILDRSNRLRAMKNLLRNRIVIKEINSEINSNKYKQISDVSLFNVYNHNLVKDNAYNPNEFNVLKYDLPFFKQGSSIYRLYNSNYYLIIKPQTIRK